MADQTPPDEDFETEDIAEDFEDEDLVKDLVADDTEDVDEVETFDDELDEEEADEEETVVAPKPATKATKRRRTESDEEDDDDEIDPDDVEADLDTILKDRIAAQPDDEDEEDEQQEVDERGDGTGRIQPKRPGEFVCQSCFLVKHPSQLADPDAMLCTDCV